MRIIVFSLIYWLLLIALLVSMSGKPLGQKYWHGVKYSSYEVFKDLLNQQTTEGLFLSIMDAISYFGAKLGYSYEAMNFVLFVILQPALMLYFLILCLILYRQKIYLSKKLFIVFNVIFWSLILLVMSPFLHGSGNPKLLMYSSGNFNLFNFCCDLMRFLANCFGLSYEEVNIILFLILQPALILYSFMLFLFLHFNKKDNYEKLHNNYINSGVN